MRLFVSLDLPDAVRDHLAAWRPPVAGARWVADGRLHLTLRFLGGTDSSLVAAITEHISAIAVDAVPVRTGALLVLPSRRRPRVLAVAAERSAELVVLDRAITAALDAAGVPPRDRLLLPHVTLARFRQADTESLRRAAVRAALIASGVATSVSLVESVRDGSGRRYETRLRVPLRETAAGASG